MLDPEAVRLQRRPQRRPARRVPRPLLDDVRVVRERRDRRGLDGRGHDHAAVLADLQQLADHHRVARHERGPVAGQVGPLGERVDGEQALVIVTADVRVQHRRGVGLPAQLQVALVADQQHPVLPRPLHRPAELRDGQHPPGRVGRRVQPEQPHPGRVQLGHVVVLDRLGAAQPRPDLVRRVGQARVRHLVAGAEPEVGRQPGHQFLGAERRQDGLRTDLGADPAVQPAGDRLAEFQRAPDRRVPGRVGGGRQGLLDHLGDGVHRGADREVAEPARVGERRLLVRLQLVPREDREKIRYAARRPRVSRKRRVRSVVRAHSSGATDQWSAFCGGRAAMNGWSFSIRPSFEAPPGEPRSSKNSTFAL